MSTHLPISDNDRLQISTASAAQTEFSIDFPFQAAADVGVKRIRAGVTTDLVLGEHYTLVGENEPAGGTLTLLEDHEAEEGDVYVRYGRTQLTRTQSITRGGKYSAKATDDDFDRSLLVQQELSRDLARALKVKLGETGGAVTIGAAGHLPIWDEEGNLAEGPAAGDIADAEENAAAAAASAASSAASAGTALGHAITAEEHRNAAEGFKDDAEAAAASAAGAAAAAIVAAIDDLIAGAPGALDTLNELATALGDDPNFATTVANALAARLPLAGGTMTGPIGFTHQASPANPAAGVLALFAKSDEKLYTRTSAGVETEVGSGGAGISDGDKGEVVVSGSGAVWTVKNNALFALEIADLKGDRMGMVGGIADPFDDETDVDTGTSTNESYSAGSDLYSPSRTGTAISGATGTEIGNMTDGAALSTAFDSNTSSGPQRNTATSGYAGKNYAGGKRIASVDVQGLAAAGLAGGTGDNITLTLYGKTSAPSSGTDGTVLGTNGPFVDPDDATLKQITSSDVDTLYTHVWVLISKSGAAVTIVFGELVFYESVVNNMTLVSNAFTAAASPDTGRIAVQVVENESITINTDLTAEISRDGGTTWTAATLALISDPVGSYKIYEDGSVDISAQPSGTSMKWRIKTLKDIDVSGVVFQWS